MFVASMNPCPCGFYGVKEKECVCSQLSINRYMNKISGPLLDRIDVQIEVKPVDYKNLKESKKGKTSKEIRQKVNFAKNIQLERYKDYNFYSNSEIPTNLIEKYCKLDDKAENILMSAFNKLGLSARAYTRILKVARTIADLDGKEVIESEHIAEAIQYRNLDRKYWKN